MRIAVALVPLSAAMQSVNLDALRQLRFLVRNPRLLVPHLIVETVDELDAERLYKAGVRAVVFDKDNTLTPPYSMRPTDGALRAIDRAVKVFGRENCAVLSNSAGSSDDPDYREAKALETNLGIQVIRHQRKKPACIDDVTGALNHDRQAIAVVGDRLLTDVFFANFFHMVAIHTKPITLAGDNGPAMVLRFLENHLILPLNLTPPHHPVYDHLLRKELM